MQIKIRSFVLALALCNNVLAENQLYVAPTGVDTASGTVDAPLATLEGARDRIRELRADGRIEEGPIEVLIQPGRYELSSTLEFTEEDSGTELQPVIYRSIGGEVIVSGGRVLPEGKPLQGSHLLLPWTSGAKENVRLISLSSLGIHSGHLQSLRLNQSMPTIPLELFANGNRLPRASWPNDSWAVVNKNSNHGNHRQWRLEKKLPKSESSQAWACGFWENDWSSSFEPISIGADRETVTLSPSDAKNPSAIREGSRYRLCNLLSELDAPGEWYIDEAGQSLFYWPIEEGHAITASVLETVLSLYDVESVRFEGIRFESARSMVVEVVSGCDVQLKDCSIAQAGNLGVHLFRGKQHQLVGCRIATTGSSAIRVEGGDRETLTPCEHRIEACDIHDFSQLYLAGRPGVALYGVGVQVCQNHIHHGPDAGIALFGNEHLIENNEIDHVCRESDDVGGVYLANDPTYRGNVIRKNYLHDLGGFSKTGVIGIYLDDFISGTLVEDNYLVNTVRGIAIGGGRDNTVRNNRIVRCLAAIQMDARGMNWAKHQLGKNGPYSKLVEETLASSTAMLDAYPALRNLLDDEPGIPKGNVVSGNAFDSPIGVDLQGVDQKLVVLENNHRRSTKDLANASLQETLDAMGISLWSEPDPATPSPSDRTGKFTSVSN